MSLNLVAKPGVRLLSGLVTLEREGDQLLQEFFQLNREPNLAEIDMLADACNTLKETVVFWCKYNFNQASTRSELTRCSCT